MKKTDKVYQKTDVLSKMSHSRTLINIILSVYTETDRHFLLIKLLLDTLKVKISHFIKFIFFVQIFQKISFNLSICITNIKSCTLSNDYQLVTTRDTLCLISRLFSPIITKFNDLLHLRRVFHKSLNKIQYAHFNKQRQIIF